MNNRGNTTNLIRKPNLLPHIPKVAGIYLITCNETGKSYVGSTTNLNVRLSGYLCLSSRKAGILKELDISKCKIQVLEKCQYITKQQRLELEREYIVNLNTIYPNGFNKRCPVTLQSFLKQPKEKKAQKKKKTIFKSSYGKPAAIGVNVLKNY